MLSHGLRWARVSVAAILSAYVLFGAKGAEASRTVVVGPKTTLDGLASRFGVPKKAIADANRISVDAVLIDGRTLIIPDPPKRVVDKQTLAAAGRIMGDRIALRMGPGTDHVRITLVDDGTPLTVTARRGEWLQVKTAEIPHGWVRSDFVKMCGSGTAPRSAGSAGTTPLRTPKASATTSRKTASSGGALRCIKGDRIALRQKPGTDSARLALMDDGTPLKVLGKSGEWCHVRVLGGPAGWVKAVFVAERSRVGLSPASVVAARNADRKREEAARERRQRVASQERRRARSSASAEHSHRTASATTRKSRRFVRHSRPEAGAPDASSDVVRTAYNYRGVRYRYGASGERGFDCSGFTSYVYGKKGVSLPHNAAEQFEHGRRVAKSDLKPGDLVFFHTTRRSISHVGIYVGDGKFVHASSAGGRVRVDSLNSGYYSNRFRGARRVK
jgi:cell wall-associated NlpC family hydrolase